MITCLGLAPALDITYGLPAVRVGRIHRPEWVLELAGGKSLNVARALTTLGTPARAIAPLGGPAGTAMAASLAAEGIPVSVVPVPSTRRCITALSAEDGTATEFYEPALPLTADAWDRLGELVDRVRGGWLAVSGSVPPDRAEPLGGLLARAVARGVRVAVDLQGAALRAALERAPVTVAKVNREEAADLFGTGTAAELADRLHGAGAGLAVVTDGADGAVADSGSETLRALPGERGRYAVGSGDCFLAGLLTGLVRDAGLAEALALATAAASANTRVPGAARFTAADVEQVLATVRLEAATP